MKLRDKCGSRRPNAVLSIVEANGLEKLLLEQAANSDKTRGAVAQAAKAYRGDNHTLLSRVDVASGKHFALSNQAIAAGLRAWRAQYKKWGQVLGVASVTAPSNKTTT